MLAFVGLIFYLISSILAPAAWVPAVYGQPLDWWIFFFILIGGLFSANPARIQRILSARQVRVVGLYVLVCLASLLFQFQWADFWVQLVIQAKLFAWFLMFALFADSFSKIRILLTVIVVQAAVLGIQGIQQIQSGVGWANQGMYWGGRIDWVGMYNGANVLCMLFVIAFAMILFLGLGSAPLPTRILSLLASPFIIVGVYLTNSRGGFVGLLAVVFLRFFITKKGIAKIRAPRLVAAGVLGFACLLVAPSRMAELDDQDHSAEGRINQWQEGLEILRYENPLLGIGKGRWMDHSSRAAHNSFVQSAGETGLIGFFLWLSMLYYLFKSLIIALAESDSPREDSVIAALLLAVSGFLVCSFFITTTQFDLVYIFSGLTVSIMELKGLKVRLTGRDFLRIGVIECSVIVLIYATVRAFYAGLFG